MAVGLIRTVILYLLMVIAIRCMGKRQLGELEPTELVITLLISDLATLSMQDLETPLLNSVIPIVTLVVLQVIFSFAMLKIPFFRRILSGRYSVLIDDGKINQKEMRKSLLTVSELMEELRQNGLMSVEDVKYCIMETDGKISVIPKKGAGQKALPLILISDGVVISENVNQIGLSKVDLKEILHREGAASESRVFLLYEMNGRYTCVLKEMGV